MYDKFFKRVLDLILSLTAAIILLPLLLVLTLIGTVVMKGNPFFIQPRPGRISAKTGKEKVFNLVKFRSMSNQTDDDGVLLPDDVRLTRYGRFLRSTSLDELPELFNIIAGNMSIVGPRPLLVRDMVFMTPEQRKRHTARAGLTGLAQCNGRNNMTWEKKFEYDLEYIKNITLCNDIKIVFKTAAKVFSREGISEEGMATAMDLGDYLFAKGAVSSAVYVEKQEEARNILNGISEKEKTSVH